MHINLSVVLFCLCRSGPARVDEVFDLGVRDAVSMCRSHAMHGRYLYVKNSVLLKQQHQLQKMYRRRHRRRCRLYAQHTMRRAALAFVPMCMCRLCKPCVHIDDTNALVKVDTLGRNERDASPRPWGRVK